MIGIFQKEENPIIDEQIAKVREELNTYDVNSEEYRAAFGYLEKLMDLKAKRRRENVSPDTMANVVGTLFGILIIVMYEQKHVMVSKGFGFRINKNTGTSN